MGEDCMLWSYGKNGCLIRIALLKYTKDMISDKEKSYQDEIKTQIQTLKQQLQTVNMGFPLMNFNRDIEIDKNYPKLEGSLDYE